MVSIQEKIRNLSMGIAVSSIMSTGAAQAQETHQQDKFPQAIEKTDEWQRVIMPDKDMFSLYKYHTEEEARQANREYAQANGDLYWVLKRMPNASNEEKEKHLNEYNHFYTETKDKSLKAILDPNNTYYSLPSRDRAAKFYLTIAPRYSKLKEQKEIVILNNPRQTYLHCQKEDFLKLARYTASKNLANDCIALANEQPEKVDKVLPELSSFIKQQEFKALYSTKSTMAPIELTDTVQKHILKNFNKIAPNFDKQMEAKYNERDPNTVTLKKMTPEAFYLLQNGYDVDFNSPKIAADVQRIADIINIEPDPITQTQQKTVDNHQESQTSTADKISELRGTNSISDSKKNIKNNWQQIKQNISNAKNNFNNIWNKGNSSGGR